MTEGKRTRLQDFLTDEQLEECIAIFSRRAHRGEPSPARVICDEVIRPNLDAINSKLGQENDPRYLGYVVEFALEQAAARKAQS
jgi:hypothetical protein